jgi:Ca2+-binding RTX toxin-like protein
MSGGVAGNDVLNGGAGGDVLCGDATELTEFARGGSDLLRGGAGDDLLIGDANFLELGRAGKDTLVGGAGDDFLIGDAEANFAQSSAQDTFIFEGHFGNDSVFDFDYLDHLIFRGFEADDLVVSTVGSSTVLAIEGAGQVELGFFAVPLVEGTNLFFA